MRLGLHFTRLPLRRGLDEVRFIEFPLFSVFTRWRPLRKMAPPGRVPLCNAGPGESPDLAGSGTWTAAAALESCLPPRCAERLASPASCIPSCTAATEAGPQRSSLLCHFFARQQAGQGFLAFVPNPCRFVPAGRDCIRGCHGQNLGGQVPCSGLPVVSVLLSDMPAATFM